MSEHKHETKSKESSCPMGLCKNIGFWKILSGILLILLIISIYTNGFSGKESGEAGTDEMGDYETEVHDLSIQPNKEDMSTLVENDNFKGSKDAPVTIVEWSDFECPFCVRFYDGAYQQIKTEYIDTGKVKFVFRDFPLSFHKQAQKAAESAECAGEQGKYYEMHDKLFEDGVAGGVSSFKNYAEDIGLNMDQFEECLDSGRMAGEVKKDMADGQVVGVKGTPAFLINGEYISGAQPFANFAKVIDAKLAAAAE